MTAPVIPLSARIDPTLHRPAARLLRRVRIIHPFPTLLNVAATGALACVSVRGVPAPGVLARMLVVMLSAQSAIGITNDYFDRDLDAMTKPWKPIAAGLVLPAAALATAIALVVVAASIALTLGTGSFALAMFGLACGLVYDARLKRTAFSAVPYMAAIPTLPLWVWLTLGEWENALWWLLPMGALIGLALHLANTLPDIEGDRAHGVSGLAHRLGAQRSMYTGWASFGAALGLSALLTPFLAYDLRVYVPAAVAGAACLAASVSLYRLRRDAAALQFGFGALGVGAAVLAAGWLGALG